MRDRGATRKVVDELISAGELKRALVDDVAYVWIADDSSVSPAPRIVRFLAPFDPVVWDRQRFEHLWGWQYRFEAYTPQAKRVRGYYAMPILWGDSIPGWANARVDAGRLNVDVGFIKNRPRGGDFTRELDREIARLESFLN